jgi:predicted GNAT family acetyltransferase
MAQSIVVRDNPDEHRYEVIVDGERVGFVVYRDAGRRRIFTHAEVAHEHEGQGIGTTLAREALDDVRARGMTAVPHCPFIAEFIDRHEEYRDLVAT